MYAREDRYNSRNEIEVEDTGRKMLGQANQRVWRPWAAEEAPHREADDDAASRFVPSQSRTVTREHVFEHIPDSADDKFTLSSHSGARDHYSSRGGYEYPPQQHHHHSHVPSMSRAATPHVEPYPRPWTSSPYERPRASHHSAPSTPQSSPPPPQHYQMGWQHVPYPPHDQHHGYPPATPPSMYMNDSRGRSSTCQEPCCTRRATYGPSGHPDGVSAYYPHHSEATSRPGSRAHSPHSGTYSPSMTPHPHSRHHHTSSSRPAPNTPPPGSSSAAANSAPLVKIRRGITSIEEVIKQFERGEGPNCPPLKDWSVDMRRRERSTYSQRKKLYEEYVRLGSVEAFYREYGSMSIGKIYALISSRSRKQRANASAIKAAAIRESWGKGEDNQQPPPPSSPSSRAADDYSS